MPNIRKTFNFRDGVQVDDEVLVVKGNRVGLGTTSPDEVLDVRGNIQVVGIVTANNSIISGVGTFGGVKLGSGITLDATSGVITATKFKGDGSTLSNLPTSQWQDIDVGLGFTSIYNEPGNVGIATTDPRNKFQVGGDPNDGSGVGFSSTGNIKASGIITASTFNGDLTGNVTGDLTGTASNATLAASATVATNAQGLTGTPDITVRNIKSTGISTLPTLESTDFTVPTLKGYSTLRSIHGTTTTLVVTVAAKTSAHRYNGQGSSNGYLIDGVSAPFLTFTPGRTYRFDVSDGTNALHPLRFYYDADKTTQYTTGVTINGVQGASGSYVEIVISDTTPTVLHYACSNHALMGNGIQTNSNILDTEHNSTVRGTLTATTFSGNVNAGIVTAITEFNVGSGVTITSIGRAQFAGVGSFGNQIHVRPINLAGPIDFGEIANPQATGTKILLASNDKIHFYTNNAERMTLDQSGNLNVVGIVTAASFVFGNLTSNITSIGVATATSLGIGTATANSNIQIVSPTASSLTIGKGGAVGVSNLQLRYGGGASTFSGDNALDLINNGDGNFNYFITGTNSFVWHKGNANPLMALTDSGNLGVGVTNPTDRLKVQGDLNVTGVATATTFKGAFVGNIQGNVIGNIAGDVNNTGFSTFRQVEVTQGIGIGVTSLGKVFSANPSVSQRIVMESNGNTGIHTSIVEPLASITTRQDIINFGALGVGATARCAVDFHNAVNAPTFAGRSSSVVPTIAYMMPPQVTTAQRNALKDGYFSDGSQGVPNGALIFNTTLNKLQFRVGGAWVDLH